MATRTSAVELAAHGLVHPKPRLRVVEAGSDAAALSRPAAIIHVASDGGPLRTIVGDNHRHFVGEEPSQKTGFSNPYEGATEYALIQESELRADGSAIPTTSSAPSAATTRSSSAVMASGSRRACATAPMGPTTAFRSRTKTSSTTSPSRAAQSRKPRSARLTR